MYNVNGKQHPKKILKNYAFVPEKNHNIFLEKNILKTNTRFLTKKGLANFIIGSLVLGMYSTHIKLDYRLKN
jgi:hypothetical protein